MEIIDFIDDMYDDIEEAEWEPTDTGYQLVTDSYNVNMRQSNDSMIELVVEGRDGKEIMKASQKLGPEGIRDEVTLKLALLFQRLGKKPIRSIAVLDDVIREMHKGRTGRGR
jgi:hypothetical protein